MELVWGAVCSTAAPQIVNMICDTMRVKVCEKVVNCKGLALMRSYIEALVNICDWFSVSELSCELVTSFSKVSTGLKRVRCFNYVIWDESIDELNNLETKTQNKTFVVINHIVIVWLCNVVFFEQSNNMFMQI